MAIIIVKKDTTDTRRIYKRQIKLLREVDIVLITKGEVIVAVRVMTHTGRSRQMSS